MTLYDYLSKYPQEKLEFSRTLGISESALYKYINHERVPKLAIAMRINKITGGKVKFSDMLLDPQEAEIIVNDEDLL